MKTAHCTMESKSKNTTQLVYAKILPIWSGQKIDRWKKEAQRWAENNKSTEYKYVDLL